MDRAHTHRLLNEPPAAFTTPERLGRYLLIERIGAGGMAEVFRAVTFGAEGFRRVIVVKRIRRELCDAPEFLQMFLDEAKICALLHHPNIVQVYDFGQADGAYFLAMEHIDGKDLGAVLRATRAAGASLSPTLVAQIGHAIAQGLHYAHTLVSAYGQPFHIVHRDINPSNVMLMRTGGVKILDFGIAKASEAAGKTQTQRAMLKGKLSYLSPEQARCEPLDARADLFSWGSTMWELLTGHRLFGGKTDFDRLNAVQHAPVIAPSEVRPDVPEALDRIVLRALERAPELRYQTAAELAAEMDAFLRARPPEPDAIHQLLCDHFGEESSKSMIAPPSDLFAASEEVSGSAGRLEPPPGAEDDDSAAYEVSESLVMRVMDAPSVGDASGAEPAGERGTALWVVGAAILVAVAALAFWSFRPRPVRPVMPAETNLAPAPASDETARIEIDSEPPGAQVFAARGLLGQTPLVATLPRSDETETLRFEKPGFAPATYELRPRGPGMVFVELKHATAGAAPASAP
jgi:serine/threonine-protein kinase